MKIQRASILGTVITLILVTTSACQKYTSETGTGARKAVALAELNDGSMVEVNCLVKAAQMNVDPKQACKVITQSDIQPVSSVMQALQMKGTNKKNCYYKCTGNCGWNDYYANFNSYYYSYGNNIPAQSWQNQFGVPQNYYYQYMYNYSYGQPNQQYYPQQQWYGGGFPSYQYNYSYSYGNQNQYPNQNNCQSSWYGGDFTRYGGCYNQVFFM